MSNALLIIDPQNDFCNPNGTLFVSGAEEDCERLAEFIDNNSSKISYSFFIVLRKIRSLYGTFIWRTD